MKFWCYLLSIHFLLCINLAAQHKILAEGYKAISFDTLSIYMLCKGTKSKMPIVARQFNYEDTNSTHVGIGLVINGKLVIYNMVNTSREIALRQDSMGSFLQDETVFYFSIWKANGTQLELKRLRSFIEKKVNSRPGFDNMFDLNNGDQLLYCSEFCLKALIAANKKKYSFQPRVISLENQLFENILKRKILKYMPVDFFQRSTYFKKLYEQYLP